MASDEDLAWFAGLFEGEGCINICYRPNPSKKSRKPYYLMTRALNDCFPHRSFFLGRTFGPLFSLFLLYCTVEQ
jgi:hypothetical protein